MPGCRREIIEGAPLAAHLGYLYGYALEAICAHLGRELPGVSSISRAAAWIDVVDEPLEGKGIPIGLSTLVFGVCPVGIPTPDDHPSIGSWPPHVIPGALEAIRRATSPARMTGRRRRSPRSAAGSRPPPATRRKG